MSASKAAVANAKPSNVTALIYWLLLVCGLAGTTIVRLDDTRTLVAMWFGTIVGTVIGQTFAVLRVRAWLPIFVSLGSLWFGGIFLYVIFEMMFGSTAETAALTLIPAMVCGYLSLSERGALVAFWYPAVLWMLVILDNGGSGALSHSDLMPVTTFGAPLTALPVAVMLGALFVVYLRARETRRAILWSTLGRTRLATPVERTVLRTSPLRGTLHFAWTAAVGAGAFLLAAAIAPHLWLKDHEQHERLLAVEQPYVPPSFDEATGSPCCHDKHMVDHERVKELIPLKHAKPTDQYSSYESSYCVSCATHSAEDDESRQAWSYRGTPGSGLSSSVADDAWFYGSYGYGTYGGGGQWADPDPPNPTYGDPSWPSAPPAAATVEPTPIPPPLPQAEAPKTAKTNAPAMAGPAAGTYATSTTTKKVLAPAVVPATPASSMPWRALFALSFALLTLRFGLRAGRRALTVRHLTRPFWREPLDQRISNQWERMLIGLRDAGIHARRGEEPQAFARRIGIDGMSTCATILERVRHGVRVGDEDLAEMTAAASRVYEASRGRAGAAGRLASMVRWPLT